jgi:hypothetical protein
MVLSKRTSSFGCGLTSDFCHLGVCLFLANSSTKALLICVICVVFIWAPLLTESSADLLVVFEKQLLPVAGEILEPLLSLTQEKLPGHVAFGE